MPGPCLQVMEHTSAHIPWIHFGYRWISLDTFGTCLSSFVVRIFEQSLEIVRRRRAGGSLRSLVWRNYRYSDAFPIADISWYLQCFSHVHSCLSFWMFFMQFTFLKLTVPAFQQFQHVETDLFRPIRFSNGSEALLCAQGWSQQLAAARSGW